MVFSLKIGLLYNDLYLTNYYQFIAVYMYIMVTKQSAEQKKMSIQSEMY